LLKYRASVLHLSQTDYIRKAIEHLNHEVEKKSESENFSKLVSDENVIILPVDSESLIDSPFLFVYNGFVMTNGKNFDVTDET
jgi:hypothetical protein